MQDDISGLPEPIDSKPLPMGAEQPLAVVEDISSQPDSEAYTLTIADYGRLTVSSIPVGVLCGAIFMIVGLCTLGIVKIFKKV